MELKVIPFEYCTLDRAARFFNCEIDDFFHWYSTGKIELCMMMDEQKATVLSIDAKHCELNIPYLGANNFEYDIEESTGNSYSYSSESSSFVACGLTYDNLNEIYRVYGYAYGFWKPCDFVLNTLRNGELVRDSFYVSPLSESKDYRVMISVEEGIQDSEPDLPMMYYYPCITVNDLLLSKKDLDKVNHILAGIDYTQDEITNDVHIDQDNEVNISWDMDNFSGKETSLKLIAGLALSLYKTSNKYKYGTNINRSAIVADAINSILDQGIEFDITNKQLSNLIKESFELYAPKVK